MYSFHNKSRRLSHEPPGCDDSNFLNKIFEYGIFFSEFRIMFDFKYLYQGKTSAQGKRKKSHYTQKLQSTMGNKKWKDMEGKSKPPHVILWMFNSNLENEIIVLVRKRIASISNKNVKVQKCKME